MTEICIIPTFKRPEFLHHCLKALVACEDAGNVTFWVSIDRALDTVDLATDEARAVAALVLQFQDHRNHAIYRPVHSYHGNSYNVLESLKDAYVAGAEQVYLVEDDIMVTPDFFRWHRAAQELAKPFCSIAHKNIRRKDLENGAVDEILLSRADYCSLGVCFGRESLAKIVAHATPAYYSDLGGYLGKNFAPSTEFTEQDGLISRIMFREGGAAAFPYIPRAFHVGFTGYHRESTWEAPQDLPARIEALGRVLADPESLAREDKHKLGDIEAPREVPEWESLRIRQEVG